MRRDSFVERPWQREEESHLFDPCLARIERAGKSLELELEDAALLGPVLASVGAFEPRKLCFSGTLERLGQGGFERVARTLPGAVVQCSVDFLCPMLLGAPAEAREVPDLEAFLQAALLLPRSLTAGFDFPQWRQAAREERSLVSAG